MCTGTSFFKQTKQNLNRLRIEGREAFIVNGPNWVLIRALEIKISEIFEEVLCTDTCSFKQTKQN